MGPANTVAISRTRRCPMIRISVRRLAVLGVSMTLAALALAGCAAQRDDSALLTDRIWQATEVRVDGQLTKTSTSARPTTEFAVMKVVGTTGANRYSGQYSTEIGNKIEIVLGPMTMMAGPAEAMADREGVHRGTGDGHAVLSD